MKGDANTSQPIILFLSYLQATRTSQILQSKRSMTLKRRLKSSPGTCVNYYPSLSTLMTRIEQFILGQATAQCHQVRAAFMSPLSLLQTVHFVFLSALLSLFIVGLNKSDY